MLKSYITDRKVSSGDKVTWLVLNEKPKFAFIARLNSNTVVTYDFARDYVRKYK